MHRVVASGFGVGLVPRRLWGSDAGAGTVGTALAAVVSFAMWNLSPWLHLTAAGVATGLSLWSAGPFAAGGEDPGWIVIDEMAGTLVALISITGWPWVVAWVAFRAADITKWPPGVRAAERLHGAVGVTADDLVAGLYGLAIGRLAALAGLG